MFGLQFLFGSALLAIPLAGLPVLLHLLFRRKSPLVAFPTLRFIRSSIQHTAARKKVQRWLLLACRVLLLLLLILAISQPAKKLLSSWSEGGGDVVAAIVVDTSYSMQLKEGQVSLLDKADSAVQDLLRDATLPLKDAKVALFTSRHDKDHPESFREASQVVSPWIPFHAEPNPAPLQDRINDAMRFLDGQYAQTKWLVVVTDLQRREFARPMTDFPQGRVILIDLHPEQQSAAGITRVAIEDQQPQPGIISNAAVEVSGRGSDVPRPVTLSVAKFGEPAQTRPPQMAGFDAGGLAQVRFPVKLPAGGYVLLAAELQSDENLPWAKSRSSLIEMPPQRKVTMIEAPGQAMAQRFIRLALESYEGNETSKPLIVQRATGLTGNENVVVMPLTQWPTDAVASKLRDFARAGGTVIFSLEPGLEDLWGKLALKHRQTLLDLLPAEPLALRPTAGEYSPSVVANDDWLLAGLTDEKFQLKKIIVRRFVPFATADARTVTTLLSISPADPGAGGSRPYGFLYRRGVGAGAVYTLGTLPDTNLGTHYTFLPLMVRMSLRPPRQSEASNVEIGKPLELTGPEVAGVKQLYLQVPGSVERLVNAMDDGAHHFRFDDTAVPGVYEWRRIPGGPPVALTNVQYPAAEAELVYHEAKSISVPGPGVLIVRSEPELAANLQKISEPQPRWSLPIAIVLFLLCLEALMSSLSRLWKPLALRSFMPGVGRE